GIREARKLHGLALEGAEDLALWEVAVAAAEEAERRAGGGAAPAVTDDARTLRVQVESEAAAVRASVERASRNGQMSRRLQRASEETTNRGGRGYRHAFREFGIDIESLPAEES